MKITINEGNDLKTSLTLPEKLKDLRVGKGLSLEELATETGISRSSLDNYENNEGKDRCC